MKRAALHRRTPLRSRPKRHTPSEARNAWKTPHRGPCAVCGAHGWLQRHHILYATVLKREHREDVLWDLRNALDVGAPATCSCHHNQHWAIRRIPRSLLSEDAREFMIEVLGADRALLWILRYYGVDE